MMNKLRECFGKGFVVNFNFEYTMATVLFLLSYTVLYVFRLSNLVFFFTSVYSISVLSIFIYKCHKNNFGVIESFFRLVMWMVTSMCIKDVFYILRFNSDNLMVCFIAFVLSFVLNFTFWCGGRNK